MSAAWVRVQLVAHQRVQSGIGFTRAVTQSAPMGKGKQKNPHAAALGRLGGKARKKKLTAEQRAEIARKAANARWARDREKTKGSSS
jgi:hypothetical protein